MTILLPDFDQAKFEPDTPIDNPYFPLTPGTVRSYRGELYKEEEIIAKVSEEIGEEIAEAFGNKGEFGDDVDTELDELADEIEDGVDQTIDKIVDEVAALANNTKEFDAKELAEAIGKELKEDVAEALTGEEIELNNNEIDNFGDRIIEALDDGIDRLAIEVAGEIADAQEDLFATETNQVYVTNDTKEILGVETTVVRDVAWDEGILVEDTFDWYAQDTEGNVWYMGEIATNYEYDDEGNLIETNTDGSWEAGVDGALPGYLMKANPQVGDSYYQEFYPGEAVDEAEVISLDESVSIDFGEFDNVLKTRDFTELEPDVSEFKYYAPGVGQVLADEGIPVEGGEPELSPKLVGISNLPDVTLPALTTTNFENSANIDNPYFSLTPGTLSISEGESIDPDTGESEQERHIVLITDETKEILGVTARVVQDSEFVDGVLTQDEFVYYAQDVDGNVWTLGESSTEYEYNDAGNLINSEEDGWQAGVDQSLPGFAMVATPEMGDVYYQRFNLGEEEEQAAVVSVDDISTDFGDFEDVVQIQEFSDLDPGGFALEYYAPGVGQVLEEEFNGEGETEFSSTLVKTLNVGEDGNDLIVARDNISVVAGKKGNDIIFGSNGDDILRGDNNSRSPGGKKGGDDIIYGGTGDDRIGGKGGNDELFGEAGDDKIWGDDGDDLLRGGLGNDKLKGDVNGGGSDTFVLAKGEGTDTIVDFEVGIDSLGLASGLTFSELSFQGNKVRFGNETLAHLNNVDATALSEESFVLV